MVTGNLSSHDNLRNAYRTTKDACKNGWSSRTAANSILNLAVLSLTFLESESEFVELKSKVTNKRYGSYRRGNVVARPANVNLFMRDVDKMTRLWNELGAGNMKCNNLAEMAYTVALAPCLAMELFDRQNKKGPATYFECLIGNLAATTFGKEPQKNAAFPILGRSVRMTMDFLFNLGNTKIHLPVKMSTRERVVQAWAHQRLLDSAYGHESYRGIMVLFSETKMNLHSLEVVEICVPDQWLAYQMHLAKLDKIYYFDVPERYQKLTEAYPGVIQIKPIAEFFSQAASIVK